MFEVNLDSLETLCIIDTFSLLTRFDYLATIWLSHSNTRSCILPIPRACLDTLMRTCSCRKQYR